MWPLFLYNSVVMKKSSLFKDILSVLIPVVLVFVFIKFIVFPSSVDGRSMNPNLQDGDIGFSFVITKEIKVNRFDIAVIDIGEKLLVKRVIGLPNDKVEYIDNRLFINDKYYDEPFLGDVHTDDLSIELKEDEYFCLGDNRDISLDSRYYGTFKFENLVATHFLTIYPFENFGFDY